MSEGAIHHSINVSADRCANLKVYIIGSLKSSSTFAADRDGRVWKLFASERDNKLTIELSDLRTCKLGEEQGSDWIGISWVGWIYSRFNSTIGFYSGFHDTINSNFSSGYTHVICIYIG
jgi:hypothetical protein